MNPRPLTVLLALTVGFAGAASAATDPCALLSRAEVQAAFKPTVSAGKKVMGSGDVPHCEYTTATGGLIVSVMDARLLKGKSMRDAMREGGDKTTPYDIHQVPGLGDDAVSAFAVQEAIKGNPKSLTEGGSVMVRKGQQVLMLMSIVVGTSATNEAALVKLARRAMLRLH